MINIKSSVSLIFVLCVLFSIDAYAQGGNRIDGHVFGARRQALDGITVELLDDFSRTLFRMRTSSTGRFSFSGMPAGKYKIRILPLGTNYAEQTGEVEIQNIYGDDGNGRRTVRAYANIQKDFYLRVKRDRNAKRAETLFAQDIPNEAKDLYDKGIKLLKDKKQEEGYASLISALEAFPDYYAALERLGLEYINAKYYKSAAVLLQKAVNIHPRSYRAYYGLALALYSLKINDEALKAAQKASRLNPSSAPSLLLTGTLLRLTMNFKDSEKQLNKAKKIATKPVPDIHWQLALLYANNLKRYNDAANELERFLKLQPNSKDQLKIKNLIQKFKEKAKNK